MDPSTISALTKQRTSLRGRVTRQAKELRELRGSEQVNDDDLAYLIHVLEQIEMEMSKVQGQLDSEGLIDDTDHMDKLREEVFKGKRLLSRLEKRGETVSSPVQSDKSHLKVSDVKLPVFAGDVMRWSEFWV